MRANIVIDDVLMRRAMEALGKTTIKDAVDEALKFAIRLKGSGSSLISPKKEGT